MSVIWICFITAAFAPILHEFLRKRNLLKLGLLIFAGVPLGIFLHATTLLRPILRDGPILSSRSWIPSLGIHLSTLTDGLSLLLLLLVSGIGFLVFVYTSGYLKGHPRLGLFYSYLLLFMGSMLGVILSNDLILLFVFWELTSISSFLLIGFKHDRLESRTHALQALLVTSAGGLCLLGGAVLLGIAGDTYQISELLIRGEQVRSSPLFTPSLILILLGALTKSAQFPFHFWLPNAMVAPTPVSAYLHSATMVKAGVYLLARLFPVLSPHPLWQSILIPLGSVTAVVGGVLALRQVDLKKLLAYSNGWNPSLGRRHVDHASASQRSLDSPRI